MGRSWQAMFVRYIVHFPGLSPFMLPYPELSHGALQTFARSRGLPGCFSGGLLAVMAGHAPTAERILGSTVLADG